MSVDRKILPFSSTAEDREKLDFIVTYRKNHSPSPGEVNRATVLRSLIDVEYTRIKAL